MILLLTGLDHAEQGFLDIDVAGTPFRDALSYNLRRLDSVESQVVAAAGALVPQNQLRSAGGVLVADIDAWVPRSAAVRFAQAVQRGSSRRLTLRAAGAEPHVIAVYVPAAFVDKAFGAQSELTPPSRAAEVIVPPDSEDVDMAEDGGPSPIGHVRSLAQLAACEQEVLRERANDAMEAGVRLRDPARTTIRGNLRCGTGVEIDVDVILDGSVTLGNNVKIGAHCVVTDSTLGDEVRVRPFTVVDNAIIGGGSFLGPYARVRPGTRLGNSVQIGTFVEIKNADIGAGSRINHLTFVGDATLGRNVTLGAATITCNHNIRTGVARTVIGAGAYIGSGTELVAPITIGENAVVGAGSTLTKDAPAEQLTIARVRQISVATDKTGEAERDTGRE